MHGLFCTARWRNLDLRSSTCICFFCKVRFSPTTQQEFDITTKHSMGSWSIDYLFQKYSTQHPSFMPGNNLCFAVSRFSIVQPLFSCLLCPFRLAMECFYSTHRTHLDIKWHLNRACIPLLYYNLMGISLACSIWHAYKLWHKNNEIWIHGLLKTS